jgi:signal transduction histidine kinase/CheY-like chemotaxis protein
MSDLDQRVLILAPTGRDAELSCSMLRQEGFIAESCPTIAALCAAAGQGAAALLIAEEALPPPALAQLVQMVEAQPPWSDLPVVVVAGTEFSASTMRPINLVGPLRNLMVLERPVRRLILSRTVAVAIRSRHRQYEVRAHLEQRAALLQRERAARADAERANRMKDEFLMTISHELRTPLTAIYGWARMLTTGQIRENQTRRAIETIERNARAQLQLIEDLLDVSRAISGKLRLTIRPTDIPQIVVAVVESMKPAADAKDVRVDVSSDGESLPVPADPERVQQIVWNLLSNAIKFTPAGGRVDIRVTSRAADATIVVSDTGAGIPADFLPYVFDRFRQSEGGTTRVHGGLGLGLAIVRHLVELHGGTVYAESAGPGTGATFRVVLPRMLAREAAQAADRRDPAASATRQPLAAKLEGVRVLVVDDDPSARELFEAIVHNAGGELKSAASVPEAVSVLESWWPDVLLSDIEMPDEDGYQLMEHVRQLSISQHASLEAIAVTAHSRPEDRARALEAGFHWHLSKPVEPAQLVSVLASLTGRLEPSSNTSTEVRG